MSTTTTDRKKNKARKPGPNSAARRAAMKRARAGKTRSRFPVWPVVGGVLVLGLLVAILTTAPGGKGGVTAGEVTETGPVTVIGDQLAPYSPDQEDPAVGAAAPEFEGQTFDGQNLAIRDDGRPKVIIFLAHWCPHCQAEVPRVQEWLSSEGMPEGVDLYSIATGTDPGQPNYPPSEWLERERWEVPVMVDDEAGSAAAAAGVTGFPFWLFVDGEGRIMGRASGELTVDQIEAAIGSLRN